MELSKYISTTLTEIVNGITDAQEKIKDSGAVINPKADNYVPNNVIGTTKVDGYMIEINKVDFNLVIEANDGESGKSGISVIAGVFGAGAAIESKSDSKSINSIKFSIPILFPVDDIIQYTSKKTK
jgi:hypothetical protein